MSCNERVKNIHVFSHSKKSPNKFVPEYARWFQKLDKNVVNEFWMFGDGNKLEGFKYKRFKSSVRVLVAVFLNRKASKFIFHSVTINAFLFFSLLGIKNKYLVLWGGEIKLRERRTLKGRLAWYYHKFFLKSMDGFITHIEADYERACCYSGNVQAIWINIPSFYPSNVIHNKSVSRLNVVRILIGTSALPRNGHKNIIDVLNQFKLDFNRFEVLIPLSYGESAYAREIADYANKHLVNATPIFEFMNYEQYLDFLSTIDVALFGNIEQQGMGNSISLLGFGCKLYYYPESDNYKYFNELGFKVFNLNQLSISSFERQVYEENIKLAREVFSKETLELEMKEFLQQRD